MYNGYTVHFWIKCDDPQNNGIKTKRRFSPAIKFKLLLEYCFGAFDVSDALQNKKPLRHEER